MKVAVRRAQFPILLGLVQVAFVVLSWRFVDYKGSADARVIGRKIVDATAAGLSQTKYRPILNDNRLRYPMFQDVHVMIFIGFGFLMTFLRKYSFSAVSYNLIISAIAIQWSMIVRALISHQGSKNFFNLQSMILSDFDCAVVLISFGAVLGKASPVQLLLMTLMEVPLTQLNMWLAEEKFHIADLGGSMIVHAFGAYFGIGATIALTRKVAKGHSLNESSYTSDIFSMIGTVFLWVFWPSFNAALADNDLAERAIINTYLALTAATVTTFCLSTLSRPRGKFKMVLVQNATLAGGVGVGSVANFMLHPYGALLVGIAAATISVFGFSVLQGALERIRIYDTCGVHNLHGMPGVMSGIASVIGAAVAKTEIYGNGLYVLFPQMASTTKTTLHLASGTVEASGSGRTAQTQALYQLACLGCSVGIALVGGLLTGLVMRIPIFDQTPDEWLFRDKENWEVPDSQDEAPAITKSNYTVTTEM